MEKKELDYTACETRLESWGQKISDFESDSELSEADTRSKIIDPLFIDVLGWDESQISREGHVKKIGFYDYTCNSGNNRLIIEAKKTSVDFSMPVSRVIKYKSLSNRGELKSAIEQGINYATTQGINIVAVYNGKQISVTYIPYIRMQNFNDTYLFRNTKDILDNFHHLFNLLSPIVNADEHLPNFIVPDTQNPYIRPKPPFKERINSLQVDINAKSPANELARYFQTTHDRYFSDIISDEDLLMKCYCDSTSVAKLGKDIEAVLRDRAPLLNLPIEELETEKKSAGRFQQKFLEAKNSTKMFLLLGGSGVGKTTFIYRFFNFILSEAERDFLVWIYIDFKKFSEEGKSIDEFVYSQIKEKISDNYDHLDLYTSVENLKAIFAKDLKEHQALISLLPTEEERNREIASILKENMSNINHHIKRVFEYLRSQELGTCIIYDNVDQLSAELQTRLFKHSNTLRENLKTTVICSLREEVYYGHRRDKALNYAEIELFHIPAPKFLNVLSKRIKLLKDETDPNEEFSIENEAGKLIRLKKLDIIEVLSKTFLSNPENILMVEMLGNRDLREALKIFKKILSSYNVDFNNLLISAGMHAVGKQDVRTIDYSELIRGLALQDNLHFVGSKSETLINIFDIEDEGFFSHLTKIRILKYAQSRLGQSLGKLPPGYFRLCDLYNEIFETTVNNLSKFLDICKKLQIAGALVNSNGTIHEINEDDYVILGAAGKYYLSHLMVNPFYLSLMSIDTQMANPERHNKIKELYQRSLNESSSMQKRRFIAMADHFIGYLQEEENKEKSYLNDIGIGFQEEYLTIAEEIMIQFKTIVEPMGYEVKN